MNIDVNDPRMAIARRLSADVLRSLKDLFVGKDEIIDLLGVALAGGENLFLLGPPGTAKSALVQQLGRRIDGKVFDYLLTRFTEPNELFGPFDIRRLREGELVTNTEGMLPEAAIVFLDELLNANSAILNNLLLVLNERVFRRGRETRRLPLLMVVAASNRLPDDDALAALFDRFLLRVRCDNVPQERMEEVLQAGWKLDRQEQAGLHTLSIAEITQIQSVVGDIDLSEVRKPFVALIGKLRSAGLSVSDRRAVKLQKLIAASAVLAGRMRADVTDLWVLRYIWDTEEQREILAALVNQVIEASPPEQLATSHPRARQSAAPNAEELARDVQRLSERLTDESLSAAEQAAIRDQLSLLEGRLQWVADPQAREFLSQQVNSLWQKIGVVV